jgi:hypothetical protein
MGTGMDRSRTTFMATLASVLMSSSFAVAQGAVPDADEPLTSDPIAQQVYLKASNTDKHDEFGGVVAVSGDTVVVGARNEDSNAFGVGGNPFDNSALDAGAVYVIRRVGAIWHQQAYLKASNTETGDNFGISVAISGDTIVVGAYSEDSSATGVNGVQWNNDAQLSGAAYVFVRNGTTWSQQAYLKASNTGPDMFGWSVAVSGDTIVVGAPYESSSATGVDGDESNDAAEGAGAAYVFVRNGATWSQQAYLKASNTGLGDGFGSDVRVSGDTVVVAAPYEDSSSAGVEGDGRNDGADGAGAAYVFVRNGTTWSQQAYLKASNTGTGDQFGTGLAISGDTIVVGAVFEDSSATGVDEDQSDDSAEWAGAAYVFVRAGATWIQQAYLKASNTDPLDGFGWVAISGDTIVVGAGGEDSGATGIDGGQADNSLPYAGAAYVFERIGTSWSQTAYIKASNPGATDFFGGAAISGGTLVVSASSEDSSATGVNGDQSDNSAPGAGAAYVFDLDATSGAWTDLGFGLAGVNGDPALTGVGTLAAGSAGSLSLSTAAPSALSVLFVSLAGIPVPFKGGTLLPLPSIAELVLATDPAGSIPLTWGSWPSGLPGGTSLYFQYAIADDVAIDGVALSNALKAVTP